MVDVSLLELMSRIVIEHEAQSRRTGCIVLPTIHDSIEVDHLAIDAVVERYSGKYHRCDDEAEEDSAWPRGPINSSLARHVRELCASRHIPVLIEERDGRVFVTTLDPAEPTGSLPMVLRVLAGLVSQELNHPLVILSYSLSGLDESRAALLWEASLGVGLFPPPKLQTFVPIAGGDVDVARHCGRPEGGVRLVVREGELIERGDALLLDDSLQMILRSTDDPLVLFLGAGSSASCGIPQGNYVRDRALAMVTGKPVGSSELASEFLRWVETHNRWMDDEEELSRDVLERTLTLERVLREEFFMLSGLPRSRSTTVRRMREDCERALDRQPEGRKALWELAELLPRLVVVTVNFDQLVEQGMSADHVVLVNKEEYVERRSVVLARLRGEKVPLPIIKLHGSINDLDTLVVDIRETSRGLPTEMSEMLNAMIDEVGCLPWVWIGCSMRDADVGSWLAGKNGIKDLQEWWVDPLPPSSVRAYVKRRRVAEWATIEQGLRDRQVTETSDRFLGALVTRARSLRDST